MAFTTHGDCALYCAGAQSRSKMVCKEYKGVIEGLSDFVKGYKVRARGC